MIQLMQWAAEWRVPMEAIQDLQRRIGLLPELHQLPEAVPGRSEAAVSADAVRQARELHGAYCWRNNSGAFDPNKPPSPGTRWGLGNISAPVNKVMKTSDYIGIWPFHVEPHHVGMTIGQFYAREDKEEGWVYTGTPRELAQLNFGELVIRLGGRFHFHAGGPLL